MIYLYIKTHNKTGLKYLGKTSARDPSSYRGSGKRWLNHINTHGYDVTTEILVQTESEEELKEKGIYYSELYNVVDSPEWANLKEEKGDGGWDFVNLNESVRLSRSKRMSGNNNIMCNSNRFGELNPFFNRNHSEETKNLISKNKLGRKLGPQTEEHKNKRLGKNVCPVCNKVIGGGNGNLVIHMRGKNCIKN